MTTRLLLLLLSLSLIGCPPTRTDDDDAVADDDDAADDDDDAAIPIPDPGTEDLGGVWFASGMDISTPEEAFPAGIVSESPGYIEADVDESGNAFYVFRAGASFDITISVYGIDGELDFIHMHDGAGLVFGEELTPVVVDVQPDMASGTWSVVEDGVYVFEVHLAAAGFF